MCVLMTSDAEATCAKESQTSYELYFKTGSTTTAWGGGGILDITDVLYVKSGVLDDIDASWRAIGMSVRHADAGLGVRGRTRSFYQITTGSHDKGSGSDISENFRPTANIPLTNRYKKIVGIAC